MLDTPTRKTTLRDAAGRSHEYVSHMHGAIAGIALGTELLGLLGETVVIERGVGACFTGLADGVIRRGNVKLVVRLLEHTARDGVKLDEVGIEAAYQANYGELIEVLAWVIEENFSSFSEAAVRILAPRLMKFIQTLQPKSALGSLLASRATGASGPSSAPASPPVENSGTSGA